MHEPSRDPGPEPPLHAPIPAPNLARTIRTRDYKELTYSPGDYLFNLTAKVVIYVSTPGKSPLSPDLRASSLVLTALHEAFQTPDAAARERDWVQSILEELHREPALQQPLAYLVDYVPSKWLLEQEAVKICAARTMHERDCPPWPPPHVPTGKPFHRCDPSSWATPDTINTWACEASLSGLGLSGGGIRSATFNLGILQGLAAQQKLNQFDYLASVSGGGYIHGWLAAWLRRESGRKQQHLPRDEAARAALKTVQEQMSPIPGDPKATGEPQLFAPHEIRWLRRFSNYLTPSKGLLTLDTWTAAAIWLRNTFLNQLVLIAALLCLLLAPWWLSTVWHPTWDVLGPGTARSAVAAPYTLSLKGALGRSSAGTPGDAATTLATDSSFVLTVTNTNHGPGELRIDRFKLDYCLALSQETRGRLPSQKDCLPQPRTDFQQAEQARARDAAMHGKAMPPGTTWLLVRISFAGFLVGALSLGTLLWQEYGFTRRLDEEERQVDTDGQPVHDCQRPYIYRPHCRRDFGSPLRITLTVGALLFPSIPFCYELCCPGPGPFEVLFAAIGLCSLALAVVVGGSAFCRPGVPRTVWRWLLHSSWKQIPVVLGASFLGTALFMLVAALIRTATVEHWGVHLLSCSVPAVELALGAPLLASLPFLTVSLAVGLVGHSFTDWMRELLGRILAMTLLATLGWLGLFAIALLSPGLFLDATHATSLKVGSVVVWIATTAASVLSSKSSQTDGVSAPPKGIGSVLNAELLATIGPYVYILGLLVVLSSLVQLWVDVPQATTRIWIAIGVCALLTLVFGWRLDATAFSLFPFYRNRLTRCYLGASNRSREPNPLTGFDDRDTRGLQLGCLTPAQGYPGPFPIFCATLNLTTGKELAYQERKGASFAFTPLYCGYATNWTEGAHGTQFNGFARTDTYAVPHGGLNIASAMAISGAAVSPNWGYHTKTATAFLLTMFNARLGCWLPNTRKQETSGRQEMKPTSNQVKVPDGRVLLQELTGSTDDSRDFIYLSDGGHFDNMGLYELVRRRCQDIVICDAEQDEEYKFEGIGSTIRKCRIDFGVEINLDLSKLRRVATTRFSSAHVATGSIRYPDSKAGQEGTLTYIKASVVTFKPAKGSDAVPSDLPDLPGDVQSYYLQHDHFPHDSTLQQWFTESQFESYRRLGQAVVESLTVLPDAAEPLAQHNAAAKPKKRRHLFRQVS